ncbi:hypothetical protein SERLADRAFT_390193 [Serpula lacrymans var. lacrymans S7.9]|uniref:Uncharacterized protein n=1 Tax=Serpula lacrymans var. lacrymans (strain S7.9) TaxID=578457 RepID=F8NXG1_SERL9|nr:uncharacterized protein SERLADRAFT_390193 [Serpula lacrymans var. lacrymans S7.9]EGO24633.1 hypothetical protein SERLADRAFT_390193 [Serpula lacrymans var. lacrymans S7.9]
MVSWEHQAKDPKVPQADFKDGRNDIPASNTAVKCMVSDVLGRGKGDDPQLEQVLKNASATAYGAGSDTVRYAVFDCGISIEIIA